MALDLQKALLSGGLTVDSYGSGAYQGPVQPGYSESVYRLTGQSVPVGSVQSTSTSGGGGGGGDPHINPATGVWDDNYYAQQQQGASDEVRRREEEARNAINTGYDAYGQNL